MKVNLCVGKVQTATTPYIHVAINIGSSGNAAVDEAAYAVYLQIGIYVSCRQDMVGVIAGLDRFSAIAGINGEAAELITLLVSPGVVANASIVSFAAN